ncbi:winged helix-turn-helix domain-containing protein [Methylocystis heyeri]|uniref:winged helix-turn-helix domain-containing protein n=1 Tax=Methylocystis heyeri TaxID=391905 RepID=UPI001389836D|nr:winged helix-turn-helix domain-containing protein [Methylocystis heyeri]
MRNDREGGSGKAGAGLQREVERREREPAAVLYRVGDLTIDAARRIAERGARSVCFSPKEFEALHVLANANGGVVSPLELIELVWGPRPAGAAQHLRVFIGRIRAKIEDDPERPKVLLTEKGSGYRMAPNEAARPR